MKKIILLLVIAFQCNLSAQSISIKENKIVIGIENIKAAYKDAAVGNNIVRDYYDFTDETKEGEFKLPSNYVILAIPAYSKPHISVLNYSKNQIKGVIPKLNQGAGSSFSTDEQQMVPDKRIFNNYPSELVEIKEYFWLRDFYCMRIKINSYQYDINSNVLSEFSDIKLQLSFENNIPLIESSPLQIKSRYDGEIKKIVYNSSVAEQFRYSKVIRNSSTQWFNTYSVYLKIGTGADGIYRLYKGDLEKYGIDTKNMDPRTIKIFQRGSEIPIYVSGESDGVFDENDYIDFWGSRNYSKISARVVNTAGKPYNNYLDKYTDTSIYFITWGTGNGKRVEVSNSFTENLNDTINYYTNFSHVEQNNTYQPVSSSTVINQNPEWLETEAWYWGWLGAGSINYYFPVVDLVPGKKAAIYFKAVSSGSSISANSHQLALKTGSVTVDSQSINKNDRLLLGKTFNSSSLANGSNTFTVVNYPNGTSPNVLLIDWYEIEYPRTLKAVNDSLSFEIRDSVTQGLRVIKIDNVFSDSIMVYKYKPYIKKISGLKFINSTLLFTDTVGAGSAYILVKARKALTPKIYAKKQFTDLSISSEQADYIAITHPELQKPAEDYVNFISSQYKVTTRLVMIEDIYDEFSFGYPEPESIKDFLKSAYSNWSYPKPSYVCLIGSASYDYKDYFAKNNGLRINRNLVPSFGEPVSDSWFVVWDNSFIPQLCIGRIPVNKPEELYSYLQKHKSYVQQGYDEFNKSVLFFSGGDGNDEGQLQSLKSINDKIINETVAPRPAAFSYSHFYKTAHPITDFGPFDFKYVDSKIKDGGLFISYIGHSGTRTWDNSITEPYQLNNLKGKSYLVTDFGCSTAKFAEPDVACFGSLFLLSGQAIAYVGNSSLGFTSTANTVPVYFYNSLIADSIYNLGQAHIDAKMKMFASSGYNDYTRIFSLTSTLIGDPIIDLAVPAKPNLKITDGDITLSNKYPSDRDDSVNVILKVRNLGRAQADTFSVLVSDTYSNNVIFSKKIKRTLPLFCDTLNISIPVNKKIGLHRLDITLDPENRIAEMYKDDNKAALSFNVSSVSIRPYIFTDNCNSIKDYIRFINPATLFNKEKHRFIIQKDTLNSFSSNDINYCDPDSFITDFKLTGLITGKRYWLRTKLDVANSDWNKEISFVKASDDSKIILNDSYSFSFQNLNGLIIKNNALQLSTDTVHLQVRSGGGNVSKYGSINKNGINVLPNTFSWGMGIAVFDSKTMNVDTAKTYWYGDDSKEVNNLVNLITSIPIGKIVLMNVIDDGSSNLTSALKNAIKMLGSTKVDSIGYRTPWVLIGKKGAKPGEVIEIIKSNTYLSILDADTSFIINRNTGEMLTNQFGPSAGWKRINISQISTSGDNISHKLIGISKDGKSDTLQVLKAISGSVDISAINSKQYPYIKVLSTLKRDSEQSAPELNSVGISFTGIPELGTNYNLVTVSKDTVQIGEDIKLNFDIFNSGESAADSFKVKVEVVKPDNSSEVIYQGLVESLAPDKRKSYTLTYNTSHSSGNRNFVVTIDPENKIGELYKDNNYYSIPFYIQPDTTRPTLKITFDGNDIFDGEYISSKPDIKVELFDDSFLPVTDTSAIRLTLNNKPVYYSNTKELKASYNSVNPKVSLNFTPVLADGEYTLKITGKNASGNYADSTGMTKVFQVTNDMKLIDLYNYPNPFRSDTYFTFKLTQIPDELKIKIYTVSGRMVREIIKNSGELKFDFNKIYWDGRDQDGDLLANGVYLYKILITKGDKTENFLQKMAIIR